MEAPRQMTLNQFLGENGYATDYEVLGHIHAGLRSAPQTKTYKKWNERKLNELYKSREAGVAAYREAIAAGLIKDPQSAMSRLDRLRLSASGHEDLASTHAARRLLAKMNT